MALAVASLAAPASADVVTLGAAKDNTLYEDPAGGVSNGAGQYMFTGRVALAGDGRIRRAVVAFAVADAVPPGSTITAVSVTLWMSKTPTGDQEIALHRLTADWGEGTSDAPLEEGQGTAATPGDATWRHTFFDTDTWASIGGDFSSIASAVTSVGGVGSYTWASTPQLLADVQGWLDDPASNFGWIIIGNEAVTVTTKRFNTREFPEPAKQPLLTVSFTPPGGCADNSMCDDDDVCTFDRCTGGTCTSDAAAYGDVAGMGGTCGPDGGVDIFDIFAVLDGFQSVFAAGCELVNIDIAGTGSTCRSDGIIDIFDIFGVLDAFQSATACCP